MEDIKLHKGDCLGDEGIKIIADKSVDMVCCDLPYGITYNKWDKALNLNDLFAEYMRIIKDNGCIALFSCQPFTTDLINAGRKWFKYEIIWDKNHGTDFLKCNRKPLRSHENILIFGNKIPKYNPQMEEGKPYKTNKEGKKEYVIHMNYKLKRNSTEDNTGTRFPKTILKFSRELGKHNTQKPVPLLERLIKTYTDENDLVIDNTFGSGSCAIACVNLKRKFIGWELDDKIYETAVKRVEGLVVQLNK